MCWLWRAAENEAAAIRLLFRRVLIKPLNLDWRRFAAVEMHDRKF
jgi:hypothetical protein